MCTCMYVCLRATALSQIKDFGQAVVVLGPEQGWGHGGDQPVGFGIPSFLLCTPNTLSCRHQFLFSAVLLLVPVLCGLLYL